MAGVLESVREEDYIQYYLFPREFEDIINANEDKEEEVKVVLSHVESVVRKYTQNYIWHKDSFNVTHVRLPHLPLALEQNEEDPLPQHFYGYSHYGDNIEDEWFIVFLLQQLTKEIDGLVARIVDSDGEFLLIEAADYLPDWATPETCERRVYLYQGTVHIVPPEPRSGKQTDLILVAEAVSQIRQQPQKTMAAQDIQEAIQARIQGYPGKIIELLHRTNAYVPVGVAALLKEKPNLISPAVLAFCNRDPIDMKACRAMRYFPPENRIMTSVVFTKCLYAMITHHKFNPDRRTGWNMPLPNSTDFKAHNLGVKLACGFEILIAQAKPMSRDKQVQNPVDLGGDHGWSQYLNSLKKTGYFKDLLEGSKDHRSLVAKAEEYYISHRDSIHCEPSVGQEIISLLSSIEYDVEEFKRMESDLPPPDDEKWLELCPKDLDTMLEERYGPRKFISTNGNPSNLSSQLAQFLDHMSGLDGAEFPGTQEKTESPPVRPKRGIKKGKGKGVSFAVDVLKSSEEGTSSPGSGNRVSFDQEAFSCAVQNILDFVIPEDSWDLESEGSGMSSYEDEMEMDLDQLKPGKEKKGEEQQSEMKQYMDQMDRELASTTMGQSFEKTNSSKNKGKKTTSSATTSGVGDCFEDIETFEPVDIDMNALKNILESYQSQMGGAGPATNMLGPMGVKLEPEPQTAKPEDS